MAGAYRRAMNTTTNASKPAPLFNIYSRRTGNLTGAMRRDSVIRIYSDNPAFITLADRDGREAFYHVTAEGGLRKIKSAVEASREARSLDMLRRKTGLDSRDDIRRRTNGVALAPSIHRTAAR